MNYDVNRWGSKNLTIKVTNLDTGRVDIHKSISRDEADWIALSPNLEVEIIDAGGGKRNRRREYDEAE